MTGMTKQDYKKLVLDDIYNQTQYDKEPLKNMDLRMKILDFFVDNNFNGDITDYKRILPNEDNGLENLIKEDSEFKQIIKNKNYEDIFCAYGLVTNAIFRVATGLNEEDDE